jgi:hypothetical protein
MPDFLTRLELDDFDAWLAIHRLGVESRCSDEHRGDRLGPGVAGVSRSNDGDGSGSFGRGELEPRDASGAPDLPAQPGPALSSAEDADH